MNYTDIQQLFNITEIQAKILEKVLVKNTFHVKHLFEELKLSRRTVYKNLNTLIQKGFLHNNNGIIEITNKDFWIQQAQTRQLEISSAIAKLEITNFQKSTSNYEVLNIRKGYNNIIKNASILASIKKSQIYFGLGNNENLELLVGKEIESFWVNNRRQNNIHLNLLTNKKDQANYLKLSDNIENRTTKFLSLDTDDYLNIFQDRIIYWDIKNMKIKDLKDSEIAGTLFGILQKLWEGLD
jgi:predicted DNA-binding transcriptional regulator